MALPRQLTLDVLTRLVDPKRLGYKYYLKTTHWHNTRTRVLARHGKCFLCGCFKEPGNPLQVHHLRYYRATYHNGNLKLDSVLYHEDEDEDLMVLCKSCHLIWHKHHGKREITRTHAKHVRAHLYQGREKAIKTAV